MQKAQGPGVCKLPKPPVHDEVVQLVVGDVVEGALLGGEHEAGVGAEPPQYTPPLGLPRIWVCTLLGSAAGPVVAPHALLQVAEHRLAGGRQGGLLYPFRATKPV